MVCGWYAAAVLVVCGWYAGRMRVVCACYASAMRLLCVYYAPQLLCVYYAPAMRLLCGWYAAAMRPLCVRYAAAMRLLCRCMPGWCMPGGRPPLAFPDSLRTHSSAESSVRPGDRQDGVALRCKLVHSICAYFACICWFLFWFL